MENIQINGQKIWGPPKGWKGPPPPHGTEIYIKNLPDDVSEIELFQIFSTIGRVYEVRLPVHWSGTNRGYAFVRYTNISEADAAIKAFDTFEIRTGKNLRIERSVDNTRLFLSCIPNYKTSEEIKRDLLTVVDNVESVYIYPTLENPSIYRGYAFVEFKSHRDAAIAKRILTPDVCFNLFERKCIAAWANPLPFLNENVLKTINILFMRNVPKEVKSITVKKAIENLLKDDSIQKVKRLNDFAFLTFKNHERAKAALNIIKSNPGWLGGNKIHIEWAVPKDLTNANDFNTQDCDNQRPNSSLHKKHMEAISYPKNDFEAPFEKKNLLKSQRIFKWDANLCSSEQQSVSKKSITAGKDNKSRKIIKDSQNQFIRIEENFKSGLPEIAGKHNWESNQLQNFESSFNSISKSNSLNIPLKLLPKSTSGSSLNRTDSSEGAWNFSPNSDLESDESLRSPQIKQWLGNFTNSSCPSPALTISSVESLTQWNNDDNNNQFPGGSKLIPSFNKCSVGTDYDSQRILNNSAKVLFPQVPNHNHYF